VGIAAAFGLATGFLVYQVGVGLLELVPDSWAWAPLGAIEAGARALGVAWPLAAWNVTAASEPAAGQPLAS
jgi:hypothetical protein